MTNKVTKYGLMTIAAVLLVAVAFAGAASASVSAKEPYYDLSSNTFIINETGHLVWMANQINDGKNASEKYTLNGNIDCGGETLMPIGTSTHKFSGIIDGNYKEISNFSITGSSNTALIGFYAGTRIANITISNFSVSGNDKSVGGLVGCADSASECTFENVCAKFGTVIGISKNVGGLVGAAFTKKKDFLNCSVENCMIASIGSVSADGGIGGVVGCAYSASFFDNSTVKNCSVSGIGSVGGVIGTANTASGPAFMRACNVINCIISGGGSVGGLVGYDNTATKQGIEQCVVVNCTIGCDGNKVGGLVGRIQANSECVFKTGNKLIASGVRGNGTNIAKISGSENKNIDFNVSQTQPIWLNNNSNGQYPRIYVAKSTESSKQGLENSSYFNKGLTASDVPYGAQLVTQLSGYGLNGLYAALAYVYYEREITNGSVNNGTVFAENATNPAGCITQAAYGELIHVVAVNDTAGYHFDRWNVTNSTGQITVVDGNFTMPASSVNVGAIFPPNTYTVRFDANGGVGSMADMTFTYDEGQNLTANAFQRYNSNFLYWTYNGIKYYNTEFVQNLTVNQSEIVVMTAQWETYSTGGSSSGSTYLGSNSASYTPTQQPTVKPTVAPTTAPTEKPATPTVIATEKPTTQPTTTSKSPAPLVGLLAGLGVAAVLLRLRK